MESYSLSPRWMKLCTATVASSLASLFSAAFPSQAPPYPQPITTLPELPRNQTLKPGILSGWISFGGTRALIGVILCLPSSVHHCSQFLSISLWLLVIDVFILHSEVSGLGLTGAEPPSVFLRSLLFKPLARILLSWSGVRGASCYSLFSAPTINLVTLPRGPRELTGELTPRLWKHSFLTVPGHW